MMQRMTLTPQSVLRRRMLLVLASAESGAFTRADVLSRLDAGYGNTWTAEDRRPPASRPSETNWQNRASYERQQMVYEGVLQDRKDGIWALSQSTLVQLRDDRLEADQERDKEISRRSIMYQELLDRGGPINVTPSLIRELGLYNGARGIFVDQTKTKLSWAPKGIAVALLHLGNNYADELTKTGVIYHFPKTQRPGRDESEIEAARAAYSGGVPVFVVTRGSKSAVLRDVHRGYIEEFDTDRQLALVTFVTDEDFPPAPAELPVDSPFILTDEPAELVNAKRRARPNQQRFAFNVARRYGTGCAVCEMSIAGIVQAEHLRSKEQQGTDDERNGLPLCANHHLAFDNLKWTIEPITHRLIVNALGPTLAELAITKSDLSHLRAKPHEAAISHVWADWNTPRRLG